MHEWMNKVKMIAAWQLVICSFHEAKWTSTQHDERGGASQSEKETKRFLTSQDSPGPSI